MTTPTMTFRAKIETVYNMDETVAYRRIKVPEPTRSHCDMAVMRKAPRWRDLANSDLFPAMLRRALKAQNIGPFIRLDALPSDVAVDETGFLARVTIALHYA